MMLGLSVMFHGIFGCCGHAFESMLSGDHAADCECSHGLRGGDDGGEHGIVSSEPHACPHASCHWLTVPFVELPSDQDVINDLVGAVLVELPAARLVSCWYESRPCVRSSVPALGMRAHLAFGVLLI